MFKLATLITSLAVPTTLDTEGENGAHYFGFNSGEVF